MRISKMLKLAMGGLFAAATTFAAHDAQSGGPAGPAAPREVTPTGTGFAGVYGDISPDQAESISTPDHIRSSAASGTPTLIWEALEHGEKVECLDCIASVAPLLYDTNAKTREIAAWWLRRRVFGVFGDGEVYSQTIQALQSNPNPVYRAYAAYALGEFFASPGIDACATAVVSDSDAGVRAAAASALGRLNDDGAGALGKALGDSDSRVAMAALGSAVRINSFSGLSSVAALTRRTGTAGTAELRRRALEVLDALNAADSVDVVAAAAKNDTDASVRAEACHALGTFGDTTLHDASAMAVLQNLSKNDADTFVRDQAQIALQRL